jgi:hypothetical protein
LAANLGHVPRLILADGFEFVLEAPPFDRELGAQLVALGNNLFHGQGEQHLEPPRRQTSSAPLDGWKEEERYKPGDQKAERQDHRLFNQGAASRNTKSLPLKNAYNATADS